jgi:hypothetical protein
MLYAIYMYNYYHPEEKCKYIAMCLLKHFFICNPGYTMRWIKQFRQGDYHIAHYDVYNDAGFRVGMCYIVTTEYSTKQVFDPSCFN